MRKLIAGALAALLFVAPLATASAQQSVIIRQSNNAGPVPATANGLGVTIASGADSAQGNPADAACTTDIATCTVIANLKRANQRTSSLITLMGSPMQQTGGTVGITGSVAVTGTFFQGTQPVSAASLPLPTGAATAAGQFAKGTAGTAASEVQTVQGIASMTPLLVNGSGVTQPVSASALPLPTGAATSAKQPALGTAGSPSTDVITVQGHASGTALKVDGSATTQPVSAAALPLPTGAATLSAQNTGNSSIAAVATAAGTPADAAWTGSGSATIIQLLKPVATASLSTTPTPTNPTQVAGTAVTVSSGVATAGSQRVAVAYPTATQYPVNISTATTTQIIPLSGSLVTYVLYNTIKAYGTGNFTWVYGTGTNCGTGTTALGGVNNMIANYGWTEGNGAAPVMIVPAGQALCITTSAAIQISGRVIADQK